MTNNVHTQSAVISASTTTARAALPGFPTNFARVVNSTTALCYVNAGDSGVTATAANIALGPYESRVFEINKDVDTYIAVLLSTGTGNIAISYSAQEQ